MHNVYAGVFPAGQMRDGGIQSRKGRKAGYLNIGQQLLQLVDVDLLEQLEVQVTIDGFAARPE